MKNMLTQINPSDLAGVKIHAICKGEIEEFSIMSYNSLYDPMLQKDMLVLLLVKYNNNLNNKDLSLILKIGEKFKKYRSVSSSLLPFIKKFNNSNLPLAVLTIYNPLMRDYSHFHDFEFEKINGFDFNDNNMRNHFRIMSWNDFVERCSFVTKDLLPLFLSLLGKEFIKELKDCYKEIIYENNKSTIQDCKSQLKNDWLTQREIDFYNEKIASSRFNISSYEHQFDSYVEEKLREENEL